MRSCTCSPHRPWTWGQPPAVSLVWPSPAHRRRGPGTGVASGRLAEALDLRRGPAGHLGLQRGLPHRPQCRRRQCPDRPLLVLGVAEDEAAALADRILDWRDPDDLAGLNGAEDPDYAAAGLPYGAKDGPFSSVEELRQVLGVTPDLYARLAPELTVDSGAQQIDQQFASAAVLAAVQGVPLEDAQATVAARTQPRLPGAVPAGAAAVSGRGGPVYRIRVARGAGPGSVWGPGRASAGGDAAPGGPTGLAMEALVRVEQGARPPMKLIWRRYGLAPPPPPPPPDAAGGLWR